jgi:hypothetical protein
MTITNPIEGHRARPQRPTSGPHVAFAGALAVVLTAAAVLDQSLSKAQLLPAVSALFFVVAFVVALIALFRPMPGPRMSYWDVAGGLIFISICIAALVEPDQLPRLVAGEPTER